MTQQSIGFQHYTTPPTFRVELAERPVLLDLLRAEGGRRLVLLDAPAGYGKTWLLTRWYAELRKAGSRVVWLGADPMEPAELLALMVAGFQRSGIDVGRLDGLAAQGFADVPLRAVLTALTATLEATPQPVVIFLDDLHRLGRDAVQDVLTRLVHEAPPTVRFVFSGRDLSMLPRADLRTRGELLEIGAEQLRFGRDESRSLLPLLSKEQLDRILERTEGWPVALQLARLWLQAKPERSSLLDAFSGRTTEVAEYLTEQVLADLAPDLQKSSLRSRDPRRAESRARGRSHGKSGRLAAPARRRATRALPRAAGRRTLLVPPASPAARLPARPPSHERRRPARAACARVRRLRA